MNNRSCSNQGSIIFLLLTFIVSLGAIMYSLLRTNNYCIILLREREKYEFQYQLAQGLHNFVLTNCNLKTKEFLLSSQKIECELFKDRWPDIESSYYGHCWLSKKYNNKNVLYFLHTNLICNHKVVVSVKSVL